MEELKRSADVDLCTDKLKRPRSDGDAAEAPYPILESVQCRAERALHALHEAHPFYACDLQNIAPFLTPLADAILQDCLTPATTAGMLENLNRTLTNLPAKTCTTGAVEVQEFATQLLKLLEALLEHAKKWEQVPGAPGHFVACALWLIRTDLPAMSLNLDSPSPSATCTAALCLLVATHQHALMSEHRDCLFSLRGRMVIDVAMDVLKRRCDPDARDAAISLLSDLASAFCDDFDKRGGLEGGALRNVLEQRTSFDDFDDLFVPLIINALVNTGACSIKTPTVYKRAASALVAITNYIGLEDESLYGLAPVLAAMVVAQQGPVECHLWLLRILHEEGLVEPELDFDYVAATVIPAAVGYMRAAAEHGTGTEGGLDEAAALLACLTATDTFSNVSVDPFVGCCAAETLLSCLSCAPSARFCDIVVSLTNAFRNVMTRNHECEVTAMRLCCLKDGPVGQVERRLRQLEHESEPVAVTSPHDSKDRLDREDSSDCGGTLDRGDSSDSENITHSKEKLRSHVDKLAGAVQQLMMFEVRLETLASFNRTQMARAACHLMAHAPEDRLRSMLLDWGMLRLLCNTLTDKEPCEATLGPKWHHWRTAAWALHALVARLLGAEENRARRSAHQLAGAIPGRDAVDRLEDICQKAALKPSTAPQLLDLVQQCSLEPLHWNCMLFMLKHWAADGDFTAAPAATFECQSVEQDEMVVDSDSGTAEEREARVDEELRGKVAAALLPGLHKLLQ